MHTLRMLPYDHQGGWGMGGVSLALSLQMEPEVLQPAVSKIIPTKGSRWPKSTTNKISLLRLIIFEAVCGVNPIEPLLLVLNKWMEHGNTSKNGDICRRSTKKVNKCTKMVHLGLQLDMASQCCLVAVCGTEASRRGKKWMSECRPDMIRMFENHRFLMCFFPFEEQNRITAQAKRKVSFLSHTPANRNECRCGKHFLTIPARISVLSLQNFKFVTLIRAPSQPVALFFYFLGDRYKPISLYCTIYENYRLGKTQFNLFVHGISTVFSHISAATHIPKM